MDITFCEGSSYAFKILGYLIYIIKVLIPIMLILKGTINVSKLALSKDPKLGDSLINMFYNLLAAMIIFLIPTVVHEIIYMLVDKPSFNGADCETCLYSPASSNCDDIIQRYMDKREKIKQEDIDVEGNGLDTEKMHGGRGGTVGPGVSNAKLKYVGDDHYKIKIGQREYEIYGQNESAIGGVTLRDGRSFSTGGCGPTTLASCLSSFGTPISPVEVNQAGSDVTPESHCKAIENLKKQGKLPSNIQAVCHPKSSLPNSADAFYEQIKKALMEGHDIVMDVREGSKEGQNYCNIYGEGDYFDNEGAIHAHWVTMVGYDTEKDLTFFENSCGQKKWYSLRKVMDLTYEAVSGRVFNDEGGWVGSYAEIWI